MYLDKQLMFSEAQAVTVTAASTNVVDLGADRNVGSGEPLELLVVVDEAAAAAGAATVTIELQTDDNEAFASATTLLSSAAIGKAALTAGSSHFKVQVPEDAERYLRLNYTVATGPLTAGKLTAGLILDRQSNG